MKNILKLAIFLFFTLQLSLFSFGQSPNEFKYQTVLRDASGAIMASEDVTVDIDILQSTATGTSIFTESHSVTTTAQGLINLNIGSVNDMSGIDWGANTYFMKITVNDTEMGTSQLLSVPYALTAKNVENDQVNDADADPANELQDLTLNGTTLEISAGTSADLSSLQDGTGTDDQNLTGATLTGTSLEITIENGNSVTIDLSSLPDGTGTDNQTLSEVLTQSNNGGTSQIKNIANPTEAQDAATKAYADRLKKILIGMGRAIKDIDGNIYLAVKIGNQVWMAEDLKVRHYPNGDAIPYVDDDATWAALADDNTSDAYSFYGDSNNDGVVDIANPDYGALYTYAAAIGDNWAKDNADNQGICPDGWHLPTDVEWTTLIDYLGGTSVAGGKLKEIGTTYWNSPNTGATNESGFSALPGGIHTSDYGAFQNIKNNGFWWTALEYSTIYTYGRYLSSSSAAINSFHFSKSEGFSVRCVKD